MGTKCYAVVFCIDVRYFSVPVICKTFLTILAASLHNCDSEGKKNSGFFYTFVYLVLITAMKAKTLWSYSLVK